MYFNRDILLALLELVEPTATMGPRGHKRTLDEAQLPDISSSTLAQGANGDLDTLYDWFTGTQFDGRIIFSLQAH